MDNGNYEYITTVSPDRDHHHHSSIDTNAKKVCLVCGDKALGYNFNAITCESCKAFFRRNALKQKVFKCPFREQCEITVLSRRFCQKCRLRKCLQVGMLTDLIMATRPGDGPVDRSNLKLRKRRRHRDSLVSDFGSESQNTSINTSISNGDHSVSPTTAPQYPTRYRMGIGNDWNHMNNYYKLKSEVQGYYDWTETNINFNDWKETNGDWKEVNNNYDGELSSREEECAFIHRQNTLDDSVKSVNGLHDRQIGPLCQLDNNVITCHSQDLLDEWTPISIDLSNGLSALKLIRLEELLSANEITAIPAGGPPVSFADASLADHMGEMCIRLCFQVSKRIQAFRDLLPIDQITLLKGAASELMAIRGLMVYQRDVDSWRPVGFPHRYLPLSCMPTRNAIVKLYSLFPDEWRRSEPIMLCLSSILLFDPTRANLQERETVRIRHQFYHDLLKEYLKSVYIDGEYVYVKLCQLLGVWRQLLPKVAATTTVNLDPQDIDVLSITYDWSRLQPDCSFSQVVERNKSGVTILPVDD